MASSLSSFFLSNPPSLRYPNPNPILQIHLPHRTLKTLITFSSKNPNLTTDPPSPPPPPPPPQEKRSFSVATGELFLGIAARIIKKRNGITGSNSAPIVMFEDKEEREFLYFWQRWRRKEGSVVVEDPVEPGVVWEQSLEDVEAERGRKVVTSPGFSFSAAGLLFPYHLGVAKFLLEKGYIKVGNSLSSSYVCM